MAITKRPQADEAKIAAFIAGAPDAKGQGVAPAVAVTPAPAAPAVAPVKPAAPVSSRKQAISLTIDGALLARIDEAAVAHGQSRAGAIAYACAEWLKTL
jgi:hypothetical protein